MADPRAAVQRVMGDAARSRSVRGQLYRLPGRIEMIGAGQKLIDINFPVHFTERPHIWGSGETDENVAAMDRYPTWNVGVNGYRMHATNSQLYVGCTLIVVITGDVNLSTVVWVAEGRALTPPVTP